MTLNAIPDSLRKQIELIRNPRFQPYFVAAFTLWLVGAVEIIQKTTGHRLDPRFWMLIAILFTVYGGVRMFRASSRPANQSPAKRSSAADAIVHRIVASGLTVYQDPVQTKGSDGYVVVGPSGVYAMEIKAQNVFGSRTIEFGRPDELILGGRISDRRPVQQAQATARRIQERLTGIAAPRSLVKPLVVFLNDWRINIPDRAAEVPVVNASELEQYLSTQTAVLTDSEVAEISACVAGAR